MFLTGTRVKVFSSSADPKKMGPRVGSEGFVYSRSTAITGEVPSDMLKELHGLNLAFLPVDIIFYKYGNELKQREEKRRFFTIFPYTTEMSQERLKEKTVLFMENCHKLAKSKHTLSRVSQYASNHQRYCGILLPCNVPAKMDEQTTATFLRSIISDPKLVGSIWTKRAEFNDELNCLTRTKIERLFGGNIKSYLKKPELADDLLTTARALLAINSQKALYNNRNMSKQNLGELLSSCSLGLFENPSIIKKRIRYLELKSSSAAAHLAASLGWVFGWMSKY